MYYVIIGYYQLFRNDAPDIVKSVLIMSFLVIITSLITFTILVIIEKMLIFIERIRNQNVNILSHRNRLSVHI